MIKILFFGHLLDITKASQIEFELVSDIETLKTCLIKKYPALELYTYIFAVNKKVIYNNDLLKEGDEIALLPPFTGG